MRLEVESWAPEYGAPLDAGELDAAEVPTDLEVERPVAEWEPITPDVDDEAVPVSFVDGVRRIEARVWITHDDGSARMGICASYGAGVVQCDSRAELVGAAVRRSVISTAGVPTLATTAGPFEPYAVAEDGIGTLVQGLQDLLGELEVQVAEEHCGDGSLVVLDGPLRRGRHRIPRAIGYVKSHRVSYLPSDVAGVVGSLTPGQRTPLFLIQTAWSRYCWYLRLPGGQGHPWSGVVRCEASADGELPEVIALADQTSVILPRFASERHKEPRAPQNLYPISGLERELRRQLGDGAYVHRALRASATEA